MFPVQNRNNIPQIVSMTRYIALFLLAIMIAACGNESSSRATEYAEENFPPIPFRDDGDLTFFRGGEEIVTIDIEIAESDSARIRGLMQRPSLPEKSGMLFLFERETMQIFHMSNTPLALDLLFTGSDSAVVDIDKYNRPFTSTLIRSDAPAQYVIEVPAGFADRYGLVAGERVYWIRHDADAGL